MPLILVLGFLAIAQGPEQPADAPFTIVATRAMQSGGEVVVSLGADRSRASLVGRATVVTDSGAVPATLVRTRRVCVDVCPGAKNGRVCHFEAVLRTAQTVPTALGVLPGRAEVRNVRALRAGADEMITRPDQWLDADPVGEGDSRLKWTRFPDGVYLTLGSFERDFYAPPVALDACRKRAVPPFTVLACEGAELLYDGSRAVAVSFAEYSEQAAQPQAMFQLDGRDAVLMRFGLKGEVVVALLVKENGQWRMTFRSADHPLIC
jgi:hypothetical protein